MATIRNPAGDGSWWFNGTRIPACHGGPGNSMETSPARGKETNRVRCTRGYRLSQPALPGKCICFVLDSGSYLPQNGANQRKGENHIIIAQPLDLQGRRGRESNQASQGSLGYNGFEDRGGHQAHVTLHSGRDCGMENHEAVRGSGKRKTAGGFRF